MSTKTAVVSLVALLCVVVPPSHAQTPAAPSEADTALATEIEHRLADDPKVNAQTIKIDVRGGVATLTGRVPDEDAKERAEKLAAGVSGVSKVHNQISVSIGGVPKEEVPGTIPEQMPGAK